MTTNTSAEYLVRLARETHLVTRPALLDGPFAVTNETPPAPAGGAAVRR